MATIRDFIKVEFVAAGYTALYENESLAVFSHRTDVDYWVLIENCPDILSAQVKLYSDITRMLNNVGVERNISLLVLLNSDACGVLSSERIVEIENDPLFFKKYVLQYREEAWKYVDTEILLEDDRLGDILTDKDLFSSLKDDSKDGPYSLIYTIAHKLPFVNIVLEEKKDLNSIYVPATLELSKSLDVVKILSIYGCDNIKEQLKKMMEVEV